MAALGGLLALTVAASAQDEFYKGKQIRLISSTGPGGVL